MCAREAARRGNVKVASLSLLPPSVSNLAGGVEQLDWISLPVRLVGPSIHVHPLRDPLHFSSLLYLSAPLKLSEAPPGSPAAGSMVQGAWDGRLWARAGQPSPAQATCQLAQPNPGPRSRRDAGRELW